MVKREKVLIIDDDPIVKESTADWLKTAGYDVITHDNAMGSSRIILRDRPQYVLVDVMMPGMSGDELVKMLQQHVIVNDPNIKFILYSSRDKLLLENHVRKANAVGAIQKTRNRDDFLAEFQALTNKAG